MTNFDFLKKEKQFSAFADAAIAAEKIFAIDAEACAISCRRAAEFAVKWMYSVDGALKKPAYDNTLAVLTSAEELQTRGKRHHKAARFYPQSRQQRGAFRQKSKARAGATVP